LSGDCQSSPARPRRLNLSIFFPCYNDAHTICALVEQACKVAATHTDDYEVIVVDDGSEDDSRALLQQLAARNGRLRLVLHERNLGYGAALRSGFRHATREWVFYTDGDGQYDVRELSALIARMEDGVDAVFAYKLLRHDPPYRLLISKVYQRAMRWLFGIRARDLSCDFRLIRRSALDKVALDLDSGAICVELVLQLERSGARIVECPVHHYARRYGESQFFRPRHLAATAIELLGFWRRQNRGNGRR